MAIDERSLAKLPGVQAAVAKTANGIYAKARANFAAHNHPGGHRIGKKKHSINYLVYLEGPAPGAVEFGHFTHRGHKWVKGIHVLGKASR